MSRKGNDRRRPWSSRVIMKPVEKSWKDTRDVPKEVTRTKHGYVQIIVFLVCKQIALGTIFHSKLDSNHSYFIVISHPPN